LSVDVAVAGESLAINTSIFECPRVSPVGLFLSLRGWHRARIADVRCVFDVN